MTAETGSKRGLWAVLRQTGLYLFCFVFFLLVFVVALFPEQAFIHWLTVRAEQAAGISIQTRAPDLVRPLAIRADFLQLRSRDGQILLAACEEPRVHFDFSALLSGRLGMGFSGNLQEGNVQGRIRTGPLWNMSAWTTHWHLQDADLRAFTPLTDRIPDIRGRITLDLKTAFDVASLKPGKGRAHVDFKDVGLEFSNAFVEKLPVSDARGSFALDWNATIAFLEEGRFSGRGFDGSLGGTIAGPSRYLRAGLNLRGELTIDPDALGMDMSPALKRMLRSSGAFAFTVRGTPADPVLGFE
jgi:type II secretion system protein N